MTPEHKARIKLSASLISKSQRGISALTEEIIEEYLTDYYTLGYAQGMLDAADELGPLLQKGGN